MSSARILSSKKSWTIGVIYSDISLIGFEHPFFSHILQAFKSEVERAGYEIVMIVSKLGDRELTYLDWCRNKKVDGVLIVMGNINNPNIIEVVESDIPTISADIVMNNLQSVISNDYQGVNLFINFAISKGMKRIGLVSGPLTARSFDTRLNAFRDIMQKKGLHIFDTDIVFAEGFGFNEGYAVGEVIASLSERPQIYLVMSDVIAFGVIRSLESHGIKVPDDIEIVGYDDIDFAKHFTPSLSTIRQDTDKIGRIAANQLMDMIENKPVKKQVITEIPVELVHRKTTK